MLNLVPTPIPAWGALGAPLREGRPATPAGARDHLPGGDRASYWQRLIDEGIVKSGSEIARREG